MSEWVEACSKTDIDAEDLIRFDHGGKIYAIYHSPDGECYCTDGLCTHEEVDLPNGLVMDYTIECPKHNGRFDYRTGEAKGAPVCNNLHTYEVKTDGARVQVKVA